MKNLLLFVPVAFLLACSGSGDQTDVAGSDSTGVDSVKELAIYTIPSPLFIGSAMKEMGCGYSNEIIDDQRKLKLSGAGKTVNNSLLLGLYICDFGYAYMNEQPSDMNIFLGKADELIGFLNMQSPVISKIVLRLKENLNNRDSVRVLINELQEKISKHYIDNHNDIVSSYVLVGMLTEGLYLSLNACKNPNRKTISYMVNEFNQTLLQQKAFLMNLKEMLKNTGLQTDPDLFKNLEDISKGFQDLGINYSVDVKKNRIRYVYLDKSKLPAFKIKVESLRKWIREA